MSKKNGNKGGNKSGGSNTTAASPASTDAAATQRQHKKPLEKIQDGMDKAQKFISRLGVAARSWVGTLNETEASGAEPGVSIKLLSELSKEIETRLADAKAALTNLVAVGFSPASAPRSSKFTVGEIVKVDDEWMPKYTKSGLYKKEELMELEISLIGDKEILTKTKGGREVVIRTAGHLEPVSLEEAAA